MARAARRVVLCLLVANPVFAEGKTYVVDPAESEVRVHVGRAGLFKFAGHEHLVLAPGLGGEVVAEAGDPRTSSVSLAIEARALKVSEKGEPPEDVPKVQEKMVGDVLDVARFPRISFRSRSVEGKEVSPGVWNVKATGDFSLHGQSRSVTLNVRVEISGDTLKATGEFQLKHGDFGMTPVSVAGVVRVKDEIGVQYTIVARTP